MPIEIEEVYARNKASEKQCKNCIYYVENYKDDYTLRHFGYGEVKYRPACSLHGNYSYVGHNPARLCKEYKLRSSKSRTAPFHGEDSWCNSGTECHNII